MVGALLANVALLAPIVAPASAAKNSPPQPPPCPGAKVRPLPTTIAIEQVEASLYCLINRERIKFELKPLRPSPILLLAARGHSMALSDSNTFSHDSPDGTPLLTRLINTGYTTGAHSWRIAENIAWGSFPTVRRMVIAWMNSPDHRENLLNPRFREIGVGADWGRPLYKGDPAAVVATTDFGFADRGATRSKRAKHSRR